LKHSEYIGNGTMYCRCIKFLAKLCQSHITRAKMRHSNLILNGDRQLENVVTLHRWEKKMVH